MKKRSHVFIAVMLVFACVMSVGLAACGADKPGTNAAASDTAGGAPEATSGDTSDATSGDASDSSQSAEEIELLPFEGFAYDLPDGYEAPTDRPGEIHEETYTTYVYDNAGNRGEELEATLYVYTPAGYDSGKQYNVIYLMHGSNEEAGYWLGAGPYAEGGERYNSEHAKYTANVFEHMIADGRCGEAILVTPTFMDQYTHFGGGSNTKWIRLSYQFKNDILPFVEAKYSTYAGGDVSPENLIATREHRAYAGLSMGSMTGFQAIWGGCVDYFAYIGNFSGCDPNNQGIVESVVEGLKTDFAGYDIKYWFNGTGTKDTAEQDHLTNYAKMVELAGDFFSEGEDYMNGDNCIMVDKPDYGHAYNGWIVDLYNVLNVFFKVP